MKKAVKRILSLVLVVCMVSSALCTSAFAATSGGRGTQTITVVTKSNWWYPGHESITLRQDKVTVTYTNWRNSNKTKTATYYPTYVISIKNTNTGKTVTKTWDSKSITLKLDRNATYKITVSYANSPKNLMAGTSKAPLGYLYKNETSPNWWVNSTCKASAW